MLHPKRRAFFYLMSSLAIKGFHEYFGVNVLIQIITGVCLPHVLIFDIVAEIFTF